MNFHGSEFLNDLNLDQSPSLSEGLSQTDLDLFSHSDFFDLDVFSKSKPLFQTYDLPQVPVQNVKTEPDLSLDFLNIPATQESVAVTSPSPEPESVSPSGPGATQDKRKRNTAASARFRIKKKMKEQEMEQRSKQLQDRLAGLEKKLKTLEMENKCLKNLILEQNEQKNSDLLEAIKRRSILDSKPVFQFTN